MKFFQKITIGIFFLVALGANISAQNYTEILAKIGNELLTAKDVNPAIAQDYEQLEKSVLETRKQALNDAVGQTLIQAEAFFRKSTPQKIYALEVSRRVVAPKEAEIQKFYEENKDQIGNQTLEQVRPQLIAFLRQQAEDKVLQAFISRLKLKHKVVKGADINSPNLAPSAVLATVDGSKITADYFIERLKPIIFEMRSKVYAEMFSALNQTIYSKLIIKEAKAKNIKPEEIIQTEISDQMPNYSEAERNRLETALYDKLKQQYGVQILLQEPIAPTQKISVDDDPSQGDINAPVTVVMFSDFQCSACGATHPVLQEVLKEYGKKVRFVVRDFPLEIHKNSFRAAQAANAAKMQGKFFEYIDLLYTHQDALDDASLKNYAAQIGLNAAKFDLDLKSKKFDAEIGKDINDGTIYGVNSTPTIFVNGRKVSQLSAEAFRKAIEKALAEKK